MTNEIIRTRCTAFIKATNLTYTRFCKSIDLAPSSFYKWTHGSLKLGEARLQRIDEYLKQFGY